MRVHRTFAWLLGLSILITATSGAFAQKIQNEADTAGVTGKVIKVNTSEKTILVDGPNDDGGFYWVTDKTTIMNGDKKVGLGDIKPGWTVTVSYQKPDVKMVATYIEVVDAP